MKAKEKKELDDFLRRVNNGELTFSEIYSQKEKLEKAVNRKLENQTYWRRTNKEEIRDFENNFLN